MKLHQKQKEVVQSKARFKVIRAGRRGGKSTLEQEVCFFASIQDDNRHVLYLAPTQKQARAIIWEEFKRRLFPLGAVFNESRLEIRVPTLKGGTSIIYIGGWENRENYRGMKFHHITFDELDTLVDFFVGWQEIFRPALTDTAGTAHFIGTPKSESRNLQRMEKFAETDSDYACFHFTSYDNPFVFDTEIDKAKEELAYDTFKQEYLAEYIDHQGALFNYSALVDVFSNSIDKTGRKYLIVDVAGDGSDRIVFSIWDGLVEVKRTSYARLNSSSVRDEIRDVAAAEKIPFSRIIVDAVGVGEHLPHDPLLDGIIGFKSSYSPIKTDDDIVRLPNVHYTSEAKLVSDYKNLRSQCLFMLSDHVNNHKIASEVEGRNKEKILEELPLYQDASKGDGKRFATPKEDIKEMLGRSPDDSDTWIMRMYFVIKDNMLPGQSENGALFAKRTADMFARGLQVRNMNSTK